MEKDIDKMISVDDALKLLLKNTGRAAVTEVSVEVAGGLVLAHDFKSPFPMPSFTNSAMDGFAVNSKDVSNASMENPVQLKMAGASYAGQPLKYSIKKGECCKIMTGAALPAGADAVVMVEHTSGFSDNGICNVFVSVKDGDFVRYKGEEIEAGEVILKQGTVIDASVSGVLASYGMKNIFVKKPPKMSLICLGDEFNHSDSNLENGKIFDSNSLTIKNLISQCGGELKHFSIASDIEEEIIATLNDAIGKSDIIVTTGGISMGEKDILRDILIKMGVKELFWKVAQKPGKPMFAGVLANKMIIALPGNPVSAFICFLEYIYPVLCKFLNKSFPIDFNAEILSDFQSNKSKHRFIFGQAWSEDCQLFCNPSTKTGSHMLTSSLNANCIISIPPSNKSITAGQIVNIKQMPGKHIYDHCPN